MERFALRVINLFDHLVNAGIDPVARIGMAGVLRASVDGVQIEFSTAKIIDRVAPHVHRNSDESYLVIGGAGNMYLGAADPKNPTDWQDPVPVREGDSFLIPANFAHCLQRTSKDELLIAFFGSPNNLTTDRIVVEGPEGLAN